MSWNRLPREFQMLVFSALARLYPEKPEPEVKDQPGIQNDGIQNDGIENEEDQQEEAQDEADQDEEDEDDDDESDDANQIDDSDDGSSVFDEEANEAYNRAWDITRKSITEVANYLRVCKAWHRDFPRSLPKRQTICSLLLGDVTDQTLEDLEDRYSDGSDESLEENGWINEALVAVTEKGLLLPIEFLIWQGANVDYSWSQHKYGLLTSAVERGNAELVKVLLLGNPSLEETGEGYCGFVETQNTPLGHAILEGETEIAEILLEAGADTDVFLNYDPPPDDIVQVAACQSNPAMLKLLLDYGAGPGIFSSYAPFTGVDAHEAFQENGGYDPDAGEMCPNHPLEKAILGDNVETARVLLEQGFKYRDMEPAIKGARSPEMRELLEFHR